MLVLNSIKKIILDITIISLEVLLDAILEDSFITVPVCVLHTFHYVHVQFLCRIQAPHPKRIVQIELQKGNWYLRLLNSVAHNYKRSKYFAFASMFFTRILTANQKILSSLHLIWKFHSIMAKCTYTSRTVNFRVESPDLTTHLHLGSPIPQFSLCRHS